MKSETSIISKLSEVINKEKSNFEKKGGSLLDFYDKYPKIENKSSYNLPLKDTIGKILNDQLKFKDQI